MTYVNGSTFLGFPGCPAAAAMLRRTKSHLSLYRTLMTGSILKAWNWKIRDNIFATTRLKRSREGGRREIAFDSCRNHIHPTPPPPLRHPVDIDPDDRQGGIGHEHSECDCGGICICRDLRCLVRVTRTLTQVALDIFRIGGWGIYLLVGVILGSHSNRRVRG